MSPKISFLSPEPDPNLQLKALSWNGPRPEPIGSGSLLGLYYIIQKPDEARAQLAPKPMGLIAINTLTYNCGHIAWPDGL